MRSKAVQRWIASDPLRAKYWTSKCDARVHSNDGHDLAFHLDSPTGLVKKVSCMICGTLEEA